MLGKLSTPARRLASRIQARDNLAAQGIPQSARNRTGPAVCEAACATSMQKIAVIFPVAAVRSCLTGLLDNKKGCCASQIEKHETSVPIGLLLYVSVECSAMLGLERSNGRSRVASFGQPIACLTSVFPRSYETTFSVKCPLAAKRFGLPERAFAQSTVRRGGGSLC